MHLERYAFTVENDRYEFFSQGPKGGVKKAVFYQKMQKTKASLYVLSFGDWNERFNRIDDRAVTNNGDRQKILATVAATVVHFTIEKPEACIFAVGSTLARTRLYQMGIAANLTLIRSLFEVEGLYRNTWESFQHGHNYSAFLLKPKKIVNL